MKSWGGGCSCFCRHVCSSTAVGATAAACWQLQHQPGRALLLLLYCYIHNAAVHATSNGERHFWDNSLTTPELAPTQKPLELSPTTKPPQHCSASALGKLSQQNCYQYCCQMNTRQRNDSEAITVVQESLNPGILWHSRLTTPAHASQH